MSVARALTHLHMFLLGYELWMLKIEILQRQRCKSTGIKC